MPATHNEIINLEILIIFAVNLPITRYFIHEQYARLFIPNELLLLLMINVSN